MHRRSITGALVAAHIVSVSVASVVLLENAHAEEPKEPDTKPHLVPVFGGNSDQGIGGGFFASLEHRAPNVKPYVWNAEFFATATFTKERGFAPQYQDYYIDVKIPQLAPDDRLRLEVKPEYVNEILGWYGIGNGSTFDDASGRFDRTTQHDQWLDARQIWQYRRKRATLAIEPRLRLVGHLHLRFVHKLTRNEVTANDDSLVAQQSEGLPGVPRIVGLGVSWSYLFESLLSFENRDDETDTHKGSWLSAGPRIAPGGSPTFPYPYWGANAAARFYVPIDSEHLTFAMRAIVDVLVGDKVPFYELPRWSEGYAIGGSSGVRGVPAQRYAGKLKAFTNVELRAWFVDFDLFGDKAKLGAVAFVDAGRVWSALSPDATLDGNGFGLKYGVGGGARFKWGNGFLLRLDVAYSPDASPVGLYFTSGQTF